MRLDWKVLGKSFLIWVLVSFFLWIVSGDASAIVGGFIVAYLEYKFSKEKKETFSYHRKE